MLGKGGRVKDDEVVGSFVLKLESIGGEGLMVCAFREVESHVAVGNIDGSL